MPETARQQKITFGEMKESGVDRVLIYCADHKCSHSAEGRDFLMHARIAMLPAVHRNEARVFNPDRKDTHWGAI